MRNCRLMYSVALAGIVLGGVTLGGSLSYAQSAESAPAAQTLLPDVEIVTPAQDDLDMPGTAAQQDIPVQTDPQNTTGTVNDATIAQDANTPVPIGQPVMVGETPVDILPPEGEDVFYDAESLVPEGELARTAPRRVDPVNEPASRMIIVRKNASAGSDEARLVSASRAIKLGRYSSALEIYNDMYSKNRRDPAVLMGRAVALQRLGLEEEAVMAYESLLEVEPNNIEARVSMLGIISKRYPAVAMQQLKDLWAKNPDRVSISAQMAITEAQLGNYDSAIRYMGVAASMEPNNASHYYNMAIMADQAGAKSDAIRYYETALETDSIYGGGRSIPRESVYTRLAQLR